MLFFGRYASRQQRELQTDFHTAKKARVESLSRRDAVAGCVHHRAEDKTSFTWLSFVSLLDTTRLRTTLPLTRLCIKRMFVFLILNFSFYHVSRNTESERRYRFGGGVIAINTSVMQLLCKFRQTYSRQVLARSQL